MTKHRYSAEEVGCQEPKEEAVEHMTLQQNTPADKPPTHDAEDDLITRHLRRVYEDVAAEPIPEALLKLLEQLDSPGAADE